LISHPEERTRIEGGLELNIEENICLEVREFGTYKMRNLIILILPLKHTSISCIKYCSHSKKHEYGNDVKIGVHY
jgi:hypothetical protein